MNIHYSAWVCIYIYTYIYTFPPTAKQLQIPPGSELGFSGGASGAVQHLLNQRHSA